MKNTLEGINSRINEEELTVSWKRVVEITAMEQNKGKRMKTVRPLEQHQIHHHLHYGALLHSGLVSLSVAVSLPRFLCVFSLLSLSFPLKGPCSVAHKRRVFVCLAGPDSSPGHLSPAVHSRLRVPGSPAFGAGTQVVGGLHRRGCGRWSEPALGPGCSRGGPGLASSL